MIPRRCFVAKRPLLRSLAFLPGHSPTASLTMTTETNGEAAYKPRYIDIGINIADPIFRGVYYGKERHPDDLAGVVSRAQEVGCTKLIATGSDFTSCRDALKLAQEYPGTIFATAGIHPCSSSIFSSQPVSKPDEHTTPCEPDPAAPVPEQEADPVKSAEAIAELTTLLAGSRATLPSPLVAMGEFGLDYDRLHYCSALVQRHSFAAQLKVAASLDPQLPLFLHSRAAHGDFVQLLKDAFGPRLENLQKGGVVHSFTGTSEEMRELADLGLYIGVNGCSLKTEENCAVVAEIPLERIMLETDGPWCEIRPSHVGWKYLVEKKEASGTFTPEPQPKTKKNQKKEPEVPERFPTVKKEKWREGAMVKGRNEPCAIERVAKAVAAIKGVTVEELCEAAWQNTLKVFDLGEA